MRKTVKNVKPLDCRQLSETEARDMLAQAMRELSEDELENVGGGGQPPVVAIF